jgi:acetyl-CoA acetyltransferase
VGPSPGDRIQLGFLPTVGPEDLSVVEVYDLSTALELDWYEDTGLREPGGAEELLRSGTTTLGGRIAVNQGLFGHGSALITVR